MTLQQAFDIALQHHRAGRLAEAEQIYRQILAVEPRHAQTLYHLGLIARQRGRPAEAAVCWKQLASAGADSVDVLYQLSWALLDAGEPYESDAIARRIVEAHPRSPEGHAIHARALAALRKNQLAREAIEVAISSAPQSAEIRDHAGLVYQAVGGLVEARQQFEHAVNINPRAPHHYRNLAAVLDALDDVDSAVAAAEASIRLGGEDPQIHVNLSALHRRRRDYSAALAAADRALKLQPGHAGAHGARAIALLSIGNYLEGFAEYEWRWRCESFTTRPRDFGRPMWDGSDPAGRTIFVHTEQGFGDTIQFVRFVPMLAARGATVLLECHPSLRPLLRELKGVSKMVAAGMRPPDFDLHTPLLSLPRRFGVSLENLPAEVPYLTADPARVAAWKSRTIGRGMKVGLVWSGNALPDPRRTCPIENFRPLAPLAAEQKVTLFSMQIGNEKEVQSAPLPLTDLSKDLTDFAETAAAIQCLDLVITIDTAAAHLAGALGRPVWTLLPWAADWRWMLDRDDSPWYPSMRLFRQSRKNDWNEPIVRIAEALGGSIATPAGQARL